MITPTRVLGLGREFRICVRILLLCSFQVMGCQVSTHKLLTTNFAPPATDLADIEANAWLDKVQIADPIFENPDEKAEVEELLTNNLYLFLKNRQLFRHINLLPGKPGWNDLLLTLRFDQYRGREQIYLARRGDSSLRDPDFDRSKYFTPLISATLTVNRSNGQGRLEVRADISITRSSSEYSHEYMYPNSMQARTKLVEELLLKAFFEDERSR